MLRFVLRHMLWVVLWHVVWISVWSLLGLLWSGLGSTVLAKSHLL
jgi:hypothetical protein